MGLNFKGSFLFSGFSRRAWSVPSYFPSSIHHHLSPLCYGTLQDQIILILGNKQISFGLMLLLTC